MRPTKAPAALRLELTNAGIPEIMKTTQSLGPPNPRAIQAASSRLMNSLPRIAPKKARQNGDMQGSASTAAPVPAKIGAGGGLPSCATADGCARPAYAALGFYITKSTLFSQNALPIAPTRGSPHPKPRIPSKRFPFNSLRADLSFAEFAGSSISAPARSTGSGVSGRTFGSGQ